MIEVRTRITKDYTFSTGATGYLRYETEIRSMYLEKEIAISVRVINEFELLDMSILELMLEHTKRQLLDFFKEHKKKIEEPRLTKDEMEKQVTRLLDETRDG